MSSERPSTPRPPPSYTTEKALEHLEAYGPQGPEDEMIVFFKGLLEHAPVKGNISKTMPRR